MNNGKWERWDGAKIRVCERPLGFDAYVLKTPSGAIIYGCTHYLVYHDCALGQPQPWPGELAEPAYDYTSASSHKCAFTQVRLH